MKIERARSTWPSTPTEQVYTLLMDPDRLGEWVTIHAGFEKAPDRLEQGSEMIQKVKVAGQRFTVRWQVTHDERPSKVVWEGKGPAWTKARVVYDIEDRDGTTHFSYLNEYQPGGAPEEQPAGSPDARSRAAAALRETLSSARSNGSRTCSRPDAVGLHRGRPASISIDRPERSVGDEP